MKALLKLLSLAAMLSLCTFASAGAAQAKVYKANGKAKSDPAISVDFELKANKGKGGLARALSISRFYADNVPFKCSATGDSGRAEYAFLDTYTEPIPVAKSGKFKDVDTFSARGHLIRREAIEGEVTGEGKFAVITGFFKAERSEGGLEFNNCSTPKVAFTAKVRL